MTITELNRINETARRPHREDALDRASEAAHRAHTDRTAIAAIGGTRVRPSVLRALAVFGD